MYWTLELASKLEDAPWPATKDELIDYAQRSGAPLEVIENLQEMEDEAWYLKSVWTDEPVLHIFPHWNLQGHEGETVEVWAYSNCDEVEQRNSESSTATVV